MANSYIIAIDFGTAYSGYAFNLSSKPRNPQWRTEHGSRTPKTPTCILFNEQGDFVKFGYEAKMAYTKMRGDEARKYYLFENFKMDLYNKTIHKEMLIEAKNGKSMKAFKVIAESLRYLKDHALQSISEHAEGSKFVASDFTWVLTLPAIWDDAAKQFMREAGTEAGLVTEGTSDKLVLCLEPEAASIWSMQLPSEGFVEEDTNNTSLAKTPGTQYMVVDCGGGTIDITVHEVLPDETLKELHAASGNDMGGETVDKNFKSFLEELFTGDVWGRFEKKYPSEVQKMMYKFSVTKEGDDELYVECPYSLTELAKEGGDIGRFFTDVEGASWNDGDGMITISKERIRSFFDDSLRGVSKSIRDILKTNASIEYLLLVGGFASSKVLRNHIRSTFGGQCKVLCPIDAQQAIVMGAVMFGQNPKVVASRVSGLTYGIAVCEKFDPSKHKPGKKEGKWCKDIFHKLVTRNEKVDCDEVREYTFSPAEEDQTDAEFRFYSTERRNAEYVDEWGMDEIGCCVVSMPDLTGGVNRKVRLEIKFGSTEMQATVTDMNSQKTAKATLNFLSGKSSRREIAVLQ